MLSAYRVLDLTSTRSELGPMILAGLGADVVKVEPPDGGASRWAAPLYAGSPDGMGSLRFHAFNRGKRSVTIDLGSAAGREAFVALVRGADFLVEDDAPGAMAARGLGYDDLRRVNPSLVYVAISPFGQDGPYAGHATSDITLAAMGGMMAVNGDADRAPVRITIPQTWYHAAAESAVAALVAHNRRLQTGEGQFVDLSVQAAVFWTGLNSMIAGAIHKDIPRAGTLLQLGILDLPLVFPCADGEVVLVPTGATAAPMVKWFVEEGVVPASWLTDEDWKTYDLRFLSGQPVHVSLEETIDAIRRYTSKHRKGDLLERGLRESVTIAPVTTVADVLQFEHLHVRKYWQTAALPGNGTVDLPGPWVRLDKTPVRVDGPVPGPGEHTAEVLAERRLPVAFPKAAVASASAPLPFEGLKIADFSWIGVGPITAKYFADHGATVVRVETTNPPDRLRNAGPHKDGIPGVNRSQFFASFNTSKKGIALNLKDPAGLAVAKQLLGWCDVAFESFTPGTMADLGLGYEAAKALNPAIVMVSSCLMGQTGPAASLAGYGYHAAAISGFFELTGWPDRAPGGPFNAYTDVIAPRFLAATVMAALEHRRRTGEGQRVEQAQMESALWFLAPELARYQVDGTVPRRAGNESPDFAPHGAYPCAGDDQWIAIACETDAQWRALCGEMGDLVWASGAELATAAGRLAARAEIDEHLAAWTSPQERYALMARLQAAGVPAGVVQRSSDMLRDAQFAHRRFFHPMEHGEMGLVPYEGHQFTIRGYDNGPRYPAPCLGQDTVEVLTDILGMSDDEVGEALASGAVGC